MQWYQLDHMQTMCTSLQRDNHDNTSSLNFLQVGCSSWCPTNSVKALKAQPWLWVTHKNLVKLGCVAPRRCSQTDTQTHKRILITILYSPTGAEYKFKLTKFGHFPRRNFSFSSLMSLSKLLHQEKHIVSTPVLSVFKLLWWWEQRRRNTREVAWKL